ncbi:MAG: (Fe-S)-binding protein [Gammaproteobacteria bacterium]|jgi:glycolate oxidase iron-sulfur subunit|nr:(Fe-S)-binding protein [Gammaproteobacteria bacterium]MBT7308344.1 (Fe-S)-binding protein [Gammaproteobacteria bacterium]
MNTQQLIQAADRCVLCGLCSSHCPTYHLHRQEGESPRGRVMMSRALLSGSVTLDHSFERHLNHCLLCRACENSCPSEVPYGEIIDHARARLPRPKGGAWLLEWVAERPQLLQIAATTLRTLSKARFPLPAIGRAAAHLLPAVTEELRPHYSPTVPPIGRVGLFLGCIAAPFDRQTHQAAITLLLHLGYELFIPEQQQCCGALAQHHGNLESATTLANKNRSVFAEQPLDAILFTSTGCGLQLVENGSLPVPCFEICHFLLQSPNWKRLHLHPLPQRVLLHHPCSLSNVLHGTEAVEHLLEQIPELSVSPLLPNHSCCGSAGSHRLREPESASRLRQPKVDAAIDSDVSTLLSTNYGCALHLQEGLLAEGSKITVYHPITLLLHSLTPSLDEPRNNR